MHISCDQHRHQTRAARSNETEFDWHFIWLHKAKKDSQVLGDERQVVTWVRVRPHSIDMYGGMKTYDYLSRVGPGSSEMMTDRYVITFALNGTCTTRHVRPHSHKTLQSDADNVSSSLANKSYVT